jgi:TolB-like protein/DNA-binding winged helix-turn-helix (wHTH) protein/Tfp pilus assembly protein PilF
MDEPRTARFRFGVFELDAENGELRKSGMAVRLQAQPMRVLGLLVAHAGETVTREEIQRRVWPSDTHVEFDQGINACIKQIRAALGDSAEGPRFVQTIPRQGYRFVAPVERIANRRGGWLSGRRLGVAAAVGLLAVVVALGFGRPGRWFGDARSEASRPVLAILPFALFGNDPGDVDFSDALTEELIAQLGRQYGSSLAVIARTSVMKYKGTEKGIAEISSELGADFVLEGSVRRVDRRIRVVAQLIRAEDESHVWSSAFQRESEDLMGLQVELGETISRGLALKLVPEADDMSGATRPEVYDAYLRGRQLAGTRKLMAALPELERAVELDPGFAPAWVSLAQIYRQFPPDQQATSLARSALDRALALDDELPEAYFALAMVRFYKDYDLEGARQAFERAIELNPGYAEAHHNFAAYYSVTGRHEEAVASVQRARRLDPLSSMVNSDVGWYYYFARRYDEAVDHSLRTLALDPEFYWAKLCIQLAYLQRPDWEGAIEHALREAEEAEAAPELLEALSAPDRETALGAYWRWRFERLETARQKRYISPANVAQIHMALGENEKALEGLEAAFEERSGWILPFLAIDPLFDPLRGDPRFEDLLARIASSQAPASDLTAAVGS